MCGAAVCDVMTTHLTWEQGSLAAKEVCSNTTAHVVLLAHSELKVTPTSSLLCIPENVGPQALFQRADR